MTDLVSLFGDHGSLLGTTPTAGAGVKLITQFSYNTDSRCDEALATVKEQVVRVRFFHHSEAAAVEGAKASRLDNLDTPGRGEVLDSGVAPNLTRFQFEQIKRLTQRLPPYPLAPAAPVEGGRPPQAATPSAGTPIYIMVTVPPTTLLPALLDYICRTDPYPSRRALLGLQVLHSAVASMQHRAHNDLQLQFLSAHTLEVGLKADEGMLLQAVALLPDAWRLAPTWGWVRRDCNPGPASSSSSSNYVSQTCTNCGALADMLQHGSVELAVPSRSAAWAACLASMMWGWGSDHVTAKQLCQGQLDWSSIKQLLSSPSNIWMGPFATLIRTTTDNSCEDLIHAARRALTEHIALQESANRLVKQRLGALSPKELQAAAASEEAMQELLEPCREQLQRQLPPDITCLDDMAGCLMQLINMVPAGPNMQEAVSSDGGWTTRHPDRKYQLSPAAWEALKKQHAIGLSGSETHLAHGAAPPPTASTSSSSLFGLGMPAPSAPSAAAGASAGADVPVLPNLKLGKPQGSRETSAAEQQPRAPGSSSGKRRRGWEDAWQQGQEEQQQEVPPAPPPAAPAVPSGQQQQQQQLEWQDSPAVAPQAYEALPLPPKLDDAYDASIQDWAGAPDKRAVQRMGIPRIGNPRLAPMWLRPHLGCTLTIRCLLTKQMAPVTDASVDAALLAHLSAVARLVEADTGWGVTAVCGGVTHFLKEEERRQQQQQLQLQLPADLPAKLSLDQQVQVAAARWGCGYDLRASGRTSHRATLHKVLPRSCPQGQPAKPLQPPGKAEDSRVVLYLPDNLDEAAGPSSSSGASARQAACQQAATQLLSKEHKVEMAIQAIVWLLTAVTLLRFGSQQPAAVDLGAMAGFVYGVQAAWAKYLPLASPYGLHHPTEVPNHHHQRQPRPRHGPQGTDSRVASMLKGGGRLV